MGVLGFLVRGGLGWGVGAHREGMLGCVGGVFAGFVGAGGGGREGEMWESWIGRMYNVLILA